jgi:hypothetical protein
MFVILGLNVSGALRCLKGKVLAPLGFIALLMTPNNQPNLAGLPVMLETGVHL